jgi:hypothetical protein
MNDLTKYIGLNYITGIHLDKLPNHIYNENILYIHRIPADDRVYLLGVILYRELLK